MARLRSNSRRKQDLWVANLFDRKENGFFIDLGANDGVSDSHTYILEKKLNWSGICIEPNENVFKELEKNRDCVLDQSLIYSVEGKEVEFILCGPLSCIEESIRKNKKEVNKTVNTTRHAVLINHSRVRKKKRVKLTTTTFTKVNLEK